MLRRARLKAEAVERLGGQCVQCGWSGHSASFEFHHRDPTKKDFGIASHWDLARATVLAEVDKCDLLCGRCHNILHSSRHEESKLIGYVFDYRGDTFPGFYRWLSDDEVSLMIDEWRGSSEVNIGRRGKPKICRICGSDGTNIGTRVNKDVCLGCLTRMQRTRMMLASIHRLGGRCEKCGWSGHPSGFSFHHSDGRKDFLISRAGKTAWSKVVAELSGCTLLCRNCHTEAHSNRFDGKRFELAMATKTQARSRSAVHIPT